MFPREQIHIIRFEDYAKSRTESVRELYDFLTLSKAMLFASTAVIITYQMKSIQMFCL